VNACDEKMDQNDHEQHRSDNGNLV